MPIAGLLAGLGPGILAGREQQDKLETNTLKRKIMDDRNRRDEAKFNWWLEHGNTLEEGGQYRPGLTPAAEYTQGRNAVDAGGQAWNAYKNGQMQGVAPGDTLGVINAIGGGGGIPPVPGATSGYPTTPPPDDSTMPWEQGEPDAQVSQALPTYTGQASEAGYTPTSVGLGSYRYAAADGGYIALPGAQDGGAIQVGPTVEAAQQMPAQPQAAQQMPAQPQAAPVPTSSPAPEQTRRDRYRNWYGRMERLSFLNGGMEGLTQFRQMEDATSRSQALNYAQQATTALNEGMVGDAMRLGNTALESLSFEAGMEFVSDNGQLFLQGSDGTRGDALKTEDLMGFVDQWMKTPEQYLEWKKLEEEKRTNEANEALRGREVAVEEGDLAFEDRRVAAQEAEALAAVIGANARLAASIANAQENGWTTGNILSINKMVNDWAEMEFTGLSEEANDWVNEAPNFSEMKTGVNQIIFENPWDEETQSGYVDPDMAASVWQIINLPGDIDLGGADGDLTLGTTPQAPGRIIANYKGQPMFLPVIMHGKAMQYDPSLANKLNAQEEAITTGAGGGKGGGTGGEEAAAEEAAAEEAAAEEALSTAEEPRGPTAKESEEMQKEAREKYGIPEPRGIETDLPFLRHVFPKRS